MHTTSNRFSWLFLVLILSTMLALAPTAHAAGHSALLPPGGKYTVRANDTLWDIAMGHGISVAQLTAANPGVNPGALRPGQTLSLPSSESTPEPAPTGAPQPAPVVIPGINPMAQAMLESINQKRTAGGRPALAWNAQLAAAAQAHADDCAARNRGSHVGSDGARLAARLQRVGYAPVWSGENWANARSVERAMALWWNEPPGADPHVQNIMAGRATEVGIGVALGAWGYYFIADFGTR